MQPRPEILLMGDDEGTAEVAAELRIRHVPDIPRNEYGTPLVPGMFQRAEELTASNLYCYVNADIILLSDFARSVEAVAARKRRLLMIGHRWNADVPEPLDFEGSGWEERLRQRVLEQGQSDKPASVDYFVFTRGLWGDIPPFALGRYAWDDWLVFRARQRWASVVDASDVVLAIHQNHDYTHHPQGADWILNSPETRKNIDMAGAGQMTIRDATCRLTRSGLRPRWDGRSLQYNLKQLPLIHPQIGRFALGVGLPALRAAANLRRAILDSLQRAHAR